MRHCEEACLRDWRRELLAQAEGTVVEVGAGTGANLEFYPDDVDEVILTEPAPHMRDQLLERVAQQPNPDRFTVDERLVEQLEPADGGFDTVVMTLVLCSVDEPREALQAVCSALKPEGKLIFLEHVASRRGGRHTAQRIVEPVWKVCAGNCHLTRRSGEAIEEVGFELKSMKREEMKTLIPFIRPSVRGIAVKK